MDQNLPDTYCLSRSAPDPHEATYRGLLTGWQYPECDVPPAVPAAGATIAFMGNLTPAIRPAKWHSTAPQPDQEPGGRTTASSAIPAACVRRQPGHPWHRPIRSCQAETLSRGWNHRMALWNNARPGPFSISQGLFCPASWAINPLIQRQPARARQDLTRHLCSHAARCHIYWRRRAKSDYKSSWAKPLRNACLFGAIGMKCRFCRPGAQSSACHSTEAANAAKSVRWSKKPDDGS